MAFSNIIAIAIIITTAATLHQQGVTDVQSSAQAAAALKPIAGPLAELVFALGIIGTGLLAVPVLAGSTAYAIGEGRKWPVGLARKPKQAVAFYSVLALSVGLGVALNFTPIDPIKALYWSAVINGVLAAPVMTMTAEYDLAILDINLHGRYVDPVADLIALRRKPFLFASGYGPEVLPSLLKGHPLLRKPVSLDEPRLTIDKIFEGMPPSGPVTA